MSASTAVTGSLMLLERLADRVEVMLRSTIRVGADPESSIAQVLFNGSAKSDYQLGYLRGQTMAVAEIRRMIDHVHAVVADVEPTGEFCGVNGLADLYRHLMFEMDWFVETTWTRDTFSLFAVGAGVQVGERAGFMAIVSEVESRVVSQMPMVDPNCQRSDSERIESARSFQGWMTEHGITPR